MAAKSAASYLVSLYLCVCLCVCVSLCPSVLSLSVRLVSVACVAYVACVACVASVASVASYTACRHCRLCLSLVLLCFVIFILIASSLCAPPKPISPRWSCTLEQADAGLVQVDAEWHLAGGHLAYHVVEPLPSCPGLAANFPLSETSSVTKGGLILGPPGGPKTGPESGHAEHVLDRLAVSFFGGPKKKIEKAKKEKRSLSVPAPNNNS